MDQPQGFQPLKAKPEIHNVHTVRERELAQALSHLIQWVNEVAAIETGWHENVLADRLLPGEKVLAQESD